MKILWFDHPHCASAEIVGGKAASLASLSVDFPVPPGFCVTVEGFQAWHAGVSEGSADEEFVTAIRQAYETLAERSGVAEPRVAVRSSAVDEDGASASFAGVYASYLNIQGSDAVINAICRCWASAAAPRVAAYRAERGLKGVGVGVLVQSLVEADSSAVAFGADPVSGATTEIVINANYGLGESIVGGLVNPDSWTLEKPTLEPLRFRLGDKAVMTILGDECTREVAVLRTLRGKPCLTEDEVKEIGRMLLQLETMMGFPVDIECAFVDGALALLQCRPITAGTDGDL